MRLLGIRPKEVVVFIIHFAYFLGLALNHKAPGVGLLLRNRGGRSGRPHCVHSGVAIERREWDELRVAYCLGAFVPDNRGGAAG